MPTAETYRERIKAECDLPDEWEVKQLSIKSTEIAKPNGGPPVEASLEVLYTDHLIELVVGHPEMPYHSSIRQAEQGDSEPDSYMPFPTTVGVLRYEEGDRDEQVLAAVERLADEETLAAVAEARDPIINDDPMGVLEAFEDHTEVDTDAVDSTLTSI